MHDYSNCSLISTFLSTLFYFSVCFNTFVKLFLFCFVSEWCPLENRFGFGYWRFIRHEDKVIYFEVNLWKSAIGYLDLLLYPIFIL